MEDGTGYPDSWERALHLKSVFTASKALEDASSVMYNSRFNETTILDENPMTIDKSLKIQAGGSKQRNVLTRAERLQKLIDNQRWQEGDPIYGMPKVRVQKISMKKKKKVKKADDDEK